MSNVKGVPHNDDPIKNCYPSLHHHLQFTSDPQHFSIFNFFIWCYSFGSVTSFSLAFLDEAGSCFIKKKLQ